MNIKMTLIHIKRARTLICMCVRVCVCVCVCVYVCVCGNNVFVGHEIVTFTNIREWLNLLYLRVAHRL